MTKKHIDQLSLPNGFYVPTNSHKPNIPKGETHRLTRPPKWFHSTHSNQTYKKKKHIDQLSLPNGFYVPIHTHTYTSCFFFWNDKKNYPFTWTCQRCLELPIGQISTMIRVCLELHYLFNGWTHWRRQGHCKP
jgi:hypothetical protein